jgi:hypothetical protein
MGWLLGLNASSSSLPLPQVADGFVPAVPTNSKPANATPTDQTDFKQQRPELLGEIEELRRFMSNLAIEQPDHWLNWGIAQLQKKKTSTQLLEKGALSLDELAEKLAVGKIGVLEARKQFRAILKENNIPFSEAVEAEAGVFENLAFGAKQIEILSETGTQLILSQMLGSEMGFIGSGVFRIINSGLKKASLIASERGQPIVSKTILVETLKEIMAGEEWKQDFQETTQLYLTQKLGQNIPPKLGKIISSGAIYAGSDTISQVLSNLMEGKQPFESFDKDSVFISLVCGLVGGVLGIKLEKAQFGEFPQILVEAGYDGIAGLVQEMILAKRDGRTLDFKQGLEIFIQEFGGEIAGVHSAQSHNTAKQVPAHQEGQIWNTGGQVVGHTNGSDFKVVDKPTANINPKEVTVDVKAESVVEEKNNIIPFERKQNKQVQKDLDLSEVAKVKPAEAKEAQAEVHAMMVQKLEERIISLKNTIKNTQDIKEKAKLEKQLNSIQNNLARMQEVQGVERDGSVVAMLGESGKQKIQLALKEMLEEEIRPENIQNHNRSEALSLIQEKVESGEMDITDFDDILTRLISSYLTPSMYSSSDNSLKEAYYQFGEQIFDLISQQNSFSQLPNTWFAIANNQRFGQKVFDLLLKHNTTNWIDNFGIIGLCAKKGASESIINQLLEENETVIKNFLKNNFPITMLQLLNTLAGNGHHNKVLQLVAKYKEEIAINTLLYIFQICSSESESLASQVFDLIKEEKDLAPFQVPLKNCVSKGLSEQVISLLNEHLKNGQIDQNTIEVILFEYNREKRMRAVEERKKVIKEKEDFARNTLGLADVSYNTLNLKTVALTHLALMQLKARGVDLSKIM